MSEHQFSTGNETRTCFSGRASGFPAKLRRSSAIAQPLRNARPIVAGAVLA